MNVSLEHLPDNKKHELQQIVNVIKNSVPVEKVILFGSHARGDWVSDKYKEGHVIYEYESDYDVLVLVKSEKLERDFAVWDEVKNKLANDKNISTQVNLVIDTIHFVNKKLAEGNYFYIDIKREGVVLYDTGEIELVEPGMLSLSEQQKHAQNDFKFWIGKFSAFYKDYQHNLEDHELNNAAFHLSQAAESLYFAVLLVFTGYKPKSHNLEKIRSLVEELLPDFKSVFPMNSQRDKELFELLKKAYIEARYSQNYQVKLEDLKPLEVYVLDLRVRVEEACLEKIKSLVEM